MYCRQGCRKVELQCELHNIDCRNFGTCVNEWYGYWCNCNMTSYVQDSRGLCIKGMHFLFFTPRVCGRGNVFIVSVCVSVCLSVQAITFEAVDTEISLLAWWYILTISRSSLSIKVIGSRLRSSHRKC